MIDEKKKDRGVVLVVAIDLTTGRFALVLDPAKPEPHYWKFPGGGIEAVDVVPEHPFDDMAAAEKAAARELKEETGLTGRLLHLATISKQVPRPHMQYAYLVLGDFKDLAQIGAELEFVRDYSLEEIRALPNFHPDHVKILNLALEKLGVPR